MNGVPPPIPKVAFVTHSLARGGSPIFLYEHCKVLRERGAALIVISEKDGPLRAEFEEIGIRVFIMPRAGPLELGLILNIRRILLRERMSVVHLNTFSSYYKYGLMAGRMAKLPVIWGIREDVMTKRCRKLWWWIKNFANYIMPCSHEIAGKLYPNGAPSKVRVVHDGIPIDKTASKKADIDLRSSFNIPQSAQIIGCVAALEPRKGIKELIDAFALVINRKIDAHLICVGEDRSPGHTYHPMLLKRVDELGAGKRVHFTGGRSDAPVLFGQFDVFALATNWEGIARVLLEAGLAGCPVVSTIAGGNAEVIHPKKGGLLVSPGDNGGLAEAMIQMLTDHEFAGGCADYSRQIVMREFDLEKCVDRTVEIYREATG